MYRRVRSRSVDDFGTCKENAAAQCRLPTNFLYTFLNRKSALCNRILFAITGVMPRTSFDSPLNIDIETGFAFCSKRTCSVESSLQCISSNLSLWKRNKLLVVIQT